MNLRLTPHGRPYVTVLYGGVGSVQSDGVTLTLSPPWLVQRGVKRGDLWGTPYTSPLLTERIDIPLAAVAEIALDDDGGAIWW